MCICDKLLAGDFDRTVKTLFIWEGATVYLKAKAVDATNVDLTSDALDFRPLTKIREYTLIFMYFAGWGSAGANAYRYYRTGLDR